MKHQHTKKPGKSALSAKHALTIVILLVFVILLALALFFLKNSDPAVIGPAVPLTSRQLFSCTAEDVLSVTITPPEGETYTLMCKNGVLTLPDDSEFTVRDHLAESILLNVCHIYIEDTVLNTRETVVDLADFGLAPARCQATVAYRDGTTHTLYIGDQMQLGIPYRYFMWNDDPHLYAASNDVYDAFSYTRSALRSVEQPVWDSTLWDQVSIAGANARTFVETDAGWIMTYPYTYPLSTDGINTYLTSIENIRFAEYVGKTDVSDLSLYGLDNPRMTLTLHQTPTTVSFLSDTGEETDSIVLPEEEIVLHIGADLDEYYFYAEYLGVIYTATRFQAGFLFNEDLSSLLDSTPLDIPITALQEMIVEDENGRTVYTVHLSEQLTPAGELKTDEQGKQLYDVTVQKNGMDFDTDTFLQWYAEVQKLSPNGKTADVFVPASFDRTLTLKTSQHVRTVSFSRYDALHTAMSIDATTLFYAPNTLLKGLFPCP